MKVKFKIELNGTDRNPFEIFGLTQNPFPQLAIREYDGMVLRLQSLGGTPIPHSNYETYIRERLAGFSQELVDLCVKKFVPFQIVKFEAEFDLP